MRSAMDSLTLRAGDQQTGAFPIRDTTDCVRIFGVVKVSVRLHAPHSKKGSMGPCPELIMVSAPEWVGGE